jgi:hypothetical protein
LRFWTEPRRCSDHPAARLIFVDFIPLGEPSLPSPRSNRLTAPLPAWGDGRPVGPIRPLTSSLQRLDGRLLELDALDALDELNGLDGIDELDVVDDLLDRLDAVLFDDLDQLPVPRGSAPHPAGRAQRLPGVRLRHHADVRLRLRQHRRGDEPTAA